jgi:hypothetical protein
MKNKLIIFICIIGLTACTNKGTTAQEVDNISRSSVIDTIEYQDIDSGEIYTEIYSNHIETEAIDEFVIVRLEGKELRLNTMENTVQIRIKEGEYTKTFTRDLFNPCE